MPENTLFSVSYQGKKDALVADAPGWVREDDRVSIARDSSGRHMLDAAGLNWPSLTRVASVWNRFGLVFHFQCWYRPERSQHGSDSVAILVQPEAGASSFKVEITSRGDCFDSQVSSEGADGDHQWDSALQLVLHEQESQGCWSAAVCFPWRNFSIPGEGHAPAVGDVWRLNLARIISDGPRSEYLLWRPSFTPTPNILQTQALGNLFFLGS